MKLLTNNLNDMIKRLKPSKTLEMLTFAKKIEASGNKVIHMELGEPDIQSPESVKRATIEAIQNNFTHYTVVRGLLALREKICDYYSQSFSANYYDAQTNIIVTPGAKTSVFYTIATILNQQDEVILPSPIWGSYASMIRYFGAKPVFVDIHNHEAELNIDAISKAITNNTKMIILNFPSNPTSRTLAKRDYKRIVELLSQHENIYLLSDEIYNETTYNGQLHSFSSYKSIQDRCIIVSGFSKSHSMTGYRIGYALGPKQIIDKFTALQGNGSTCVTSFVQKGAIAALDERDHITNIRKVYSFRAKLIYDLITEIPGISMDLPRGAFYAFPKIEGAKKNFAMKFLEKKYVAGTSGSAFGPYYDSFIRFSFATSEENIRKGINLLKDFTREMGIK